MVGEVLFDAPYWLHIILTVLTIIFVGYVSVQDDGRINDDAIGGGIVVTVVVALFWQIIIVVAVCIFALFAPFEIGVWIARGKRRYKENKKEKEKQQKRYNHFTDDGDIDYLGASIMEENSKMLKGDKKLTNFQKNDI